MKAGSDFEQTPDAPAHPRAPLRRLRNSAQDLEKSTLAGAVAADDADNLTLLHLEADVLECPEFLDLVALNDLFSFEEFLCVTSKVLDLSRHHITEGRVALPCRRMMAYQIALGEIFNGNNRFGHGAESV